MAETLSPNVTRSVGKPIPNVSVFISGPDGEPQPVGFPGEICVGGAGVAKRYLEIDGSSAKFPREPLATWTTAFDDFKIVYRTGDKGCMSEDGSLSLAEVVVAVRGSLAFLAAHVVFASGQYVSQDSLSAICHELRLPRYMIPSTIVPLDRLPTTTNRK
jgi:aspyridone synthetase (hybrid polyketide synthase/nonribosomal peptide synthetase)